MRRLSHLIATTALAMVTLTGCRAAVDTAIAVDTEAAATITVSATFTGEAAIAVGAGEKTRQALTDLFVNRFGTRPTFATSPEKLTASVVTDYAHLTAAQPLTGVASATLERQGEGQAQLVVHLAEADGLAAAITDGVAGQPDAAGLAATMLQQTYVTLSVTFPGGVTDVTGSAAGNAGSPPWTVSDGRFELTRSASTTGDATVTVTGKLRATSRWTPLWVGGGIVAAGAALWLFRRRQPAKSASR